MTVAGAPEERIWAYWPAGQVSVRGRVLSIAECPKQVDTIILGPATLDAQRGVSLWQISQVAPKQSMISMIRRLQDVGRRVVLSIQADREHPWETFDAARLETTLVTELLPDWGFDGLHVHRPAIDAKTAPRLLEGLARFRRRLGPERELSMLLPPARGVVDELLFDAQGILSMVATTGYGRTLNDRIYAFARCARQLGTGKVAFGIRPGRKTDRTSTPKRLIKKLAAYRPVAGSKAGVLIDHLARDVRERTNRQDFAVLLDAHLGLLEAAEAAEAERARERTGMSPSSHPDRRRRD